MLTLLAIPQIIDDNAQVFFALTSTVFLMFDSVSLVDHTNTKPNVGYYHIRIAIARFPN